MPSWSFDLVNKLISISIISVNDKLLTLEKNDREYLV